jgi:hypothetical protein
MLKKINDVNVCSPVSELFGKLTSENFCSAKLRLLY